GTGRAQRSAATVGPPAAGCRWPARPRQSAPGRVTLAEPGADSSRLNAGGVQAVAVLAECNLLQSTLRRTRHRVAGLRTEHTLVTRAIQARVFGLVIHRARQMCAAL